MNKLSSEYIFYFIYTLIIIFLVNKSFSNNYIENFTNTKKVEYEEKICNEIKEVKKNDIENVSKINEIVDEFYANNHVKFDKINISNNFNYLPIGCIIPFYGLSKDIPKGWLICNGKNGTPNLINRFILGKGNNYNMNDTGGEEKVKLTTNEMPEHNHKYTQPRVDASHLHYYYDIWSAFSDINSNFKSSKTFKVDKVDKDKKSNKYSNVDKGIYEKVKFYPRKKTGSGYKEYPKKETSSHKHSHKLPFQGGDIEHNNMPPYYEFIYIIRVKI